MPKKRAKPSQQPNRFRFQGLDTVGAVDAEQDSDFLKSCFVDTGHLQVLSDCNDPRSIVVGRTGSGKTALLSKLVETQERVIEVQPESLALSYISNSTILKFFARLGVRLDIFFKLLWRHVFTVELIRHHFKIWDESANTDFFTRLRQRFLDKREQKALHYLQSWGQEFWEETEYRIREVTRKLEEDLRDSMSSKFPWISFGISDANKLTEQEQVEIIQRAQHVVNRVQIRELSEIINLTNSVLSDPQRRYFIIIDRLDEDWIEDKLRYRLIRSLIETVRDFRKIENAKIAIALRIDLIETVFKHTRSPGFQEEKYESSYLPVEWTQRDLTQMLDRRINHLVQRRYTKKNVTHKDLLPSRVNQKPTMEFILERTMMRPRDVIMFINYCILRAINKQRITPTILKQSESEYSSNRLRSLADEWVADHPNLIFFTRLLKNRTSSFLAKLITAQDVEDVCLDFCTDESNSQKEDLLSRAAKKLIDVEADASQTRMVILQVLYHTGVIGLKLEAFHQVQWVSLRARSVSTSQISDRTGVTVHPMLWRALGIRPK